MKVSDLAKEFSTTSDAVLDVLKSLKLKAKDSKQELNDAVLPVIIAALKKAKPVAKAAVEEEKGKKEKAPAADAAKPKIEKKKVVKKKTVIKKKVVAPEPPKPKHKISHEPIITLKPLARKKKKGGIHGGESSTAAPHAHEHHASHPAATATAVAEKVRVHEAPAEGELEAEVEKELPQLEIKVPVAVKDLAEHVKQKPTIVLSELLKMGIMANINQALDGEIVERIVNHFGFNLVKLTTQEEILVKSHKQHEGDPKLLKPRAPVITFMGHVDHGKTSLLDRIRKSKVVDTEHGGITQHMGAYSVEMPKGRITFLDTPGHEAFTAMRARGAHITDIVILVVAADEGIMPQTKEAIDHARAADVPIVVALNKIDKPTVNLDKVKKQLADLDLNPEDWGGKTICVGVSALTGKGVDQLLEMILLESELLELRANPDKKASGIVVEAHISQGKGVVSTLIVQSGTLKAGDIVVVGPYYGKVKAMHDDRQRVIKAAGPSMPVEVLGIPDVPSAGEQFYVVDTESEAREITAKRLEDLKAKRMGDSSRFSLEDVYSQIQQGAIKELNVILKSDVQGSLEALQDSLQKIPSDKVKLRFIHTGLGDVNASDVLLAVASKAIILAFHVGIDNRARLELDKEPVDVRQYRIIYDAVTDMHKALEGLLESKKRKKFQARIEIRQVFKLSRSGIVAGCYVQKGRVLRKAHVDIVRNGEVIHTGTLSSLKRFKDDVKEVTEGMECGLTVTGFETYQSGDIVEVYEIESIAQKL